MPSLTLTPLSTDAPDAPPRSQQQHALSLLLESSLASSPARSSYATSSDAWPPMLHDRVPQRLSSRRQQAGACSFACLLASLVSYRPLARGCGAADGSSGKLGRRRDVRALVRRSRTQPRWESPQRRRLCVPYTRRSARQGSPRRVRLCPTHATRDRAAHTGRPLRWGSPQW